MSQIASSLRGSSSPATWGSHRNNIAAKHPKLGKRNFVKGSNGNKLMQKSFAKF